MGLRDLWTVLKGGLVMKRIYNILVGFTVTFGKSIFGLFIAAMIFDKSFMNYDNTLFILGMCFFGWVIAFIYDLDIKLLFRFLLHSVLLYGFGVLSFYWIFGLELFKFNFVVVSIAYWLGYLVCYGAGIYYYKKVDADLNDTVEYIKKMEDVVVGWRDKDE